MRFDTPAKVMRVLAVGAAAVACIPSAGGSPGLPLNRVVAAADIPVHVIALGPYWKTRQGRHVLAVQRRLLASLANSDYTRVLNRRYGVKGQIRLASVKFALRRPLKVYNIQEMVELANATARKLPAVQAIHPNAQFLVLIPSGSKYFSVDNPSSCGSETWPISNPSSRLVMRGLIIVQSPNSKPHCAPWGLDVRLTGGITGRDAGTSLTVSNLVIGALFLVRPRGGYTRVVGRCGNHLFLWHGRGGTFVVAGYWNGKRCAAGSAKEIRG